jgi:hypothetical protein
MAEFLDTQQAPPLDPAAEGTPVEEMQNIKGGGIGSVMPNPLTEADESASPEEQAEYEDAFKRVMGMIHDTSENGGKKSIADAVIKAISNSQIPAHEAIGKQTGNLMRLFHETAKRAGKEYPGDVLREVGMDLATELIDIGRETGAVKNLPEEDTPEMQNFYQQTVLEAAKLFGEYMLSTGQADVQGEQEAYKEQMEREATSGALDDWNMEEMDTNALKAAIDQQRGIV